MNPPPIQYTRAADGARIAYRSTGGDGVPFILTPFPFNNLDRMWRQHTNLSLYEPLAQRFRLVHYDSRGQGMSTRELGSDHGYEDFALDLQAVVDELQLERFILFAGLFGGHMSIRYAVAHPDRVRALVLTAMAVDNPLGRISRYEDLARKDWEMAMHSFIAGNFRIGDSEGDAASIAYFRETLSQEGFLTMVRACRRSNITSALAAVKCPTLVVTGPMHGPMLEDMRKIAEAVPHSSLVLLDSGNWMSEVYTNDGSVPAIVPAIDEFVQGLDSTPMPPLNPASLPGNLLSRRELDVLRLVAEGKTNRDIAEALTISERTVINHLSNIFTKTGAENRAGAAAYALRHGFL